MRLSAMPEERRLQRAVLVVLGVFCLLLLATLVVLGSSFVAVGTTPELQAEREAWASDHGSDALGVVGLVLMPLATLVLPLSALRDRVAVGRINRLRWQYLLAVLLCGGLGVGWGRWCSVAAVVVGLALVAGIRRAPAADRDGRIEGGTFGA